MSRYRKWYVALGGVALQVLATAAILADSPALPEALRPWAPVVIALATAFGVRRVPNAPAGPVAGGGDGRHEAGRAEDGSASRPFLAALAAVSGLLLVLFLVAGDAKADPPTDDEEVPVLVVPHLTVTGAELCGRELLVSYSYETFVLGEPPSSLAGAWGFEQDRGGVRVELGWEGEWSPLPAGSVVYSIEGNTRVRVHGQRFDQVRVVGPAPGLGDVAASPVLKPPPSCAWVPGKSLRGPA